MSKRRDRTAAKVRRHRVNLDNLAPKVAQGITEGANAKEAVAELNDRMGKVQDFSGDDLVQQHFDGDQQTIGRVPVPRFVASNDTHAVWKDEPTGRVQQDAVLKMERSTFEAIKAGYICLRCLEPQDEGFPPAERAYHLPGCSYPIQERQALDVRMEFEGEAHVGPGLPISQWEAEQAERMERAEHARRRKEGGSPMGAISRKLLSPGAKRLRGLTGRVHADAGLVKAMEKSDAKKD